MSKVYRFDTLSRFSSGISLEELSNEVAQALSLAETGVWKDLRIGVERDPYDPFESWELAIIGQRQETDEEYKARTKELAKKEARAKREEEKKKAKELAQKKSRQQKAREQREKLRNKLLKSEYKMYEQLKKKFEKENP